MKQIVIGVMLMMVFVWGCKEDAPPELSMNVQTDLVETKRDFDWVEIRCAAFKSGGSQEQVISKIGVCYSATEKNPTVENSKVLEMDYKQDQQWYNLRMEVSPGTTIYARPFARVTPLRDIDKPVYYGAEIASYSTLAAPVIIKVTPLKGYFNDTVSIAGEGFSYYNSENKVYFNDVEATLLNISGEQNLKVLVPRKAGKGKIKVTVRGTVIEGPEFDFKQASYDVYTLCGKPEAGFADGNLDEAKFNNPCHIVLDKNGNLIVADRGNHRIRKISPDGIVTTLAGSGVAGYADGPAANAQFKEPLCLAVHPVTGDIYITESSHCIRKISADGATVSTFKGIYDQPGAVDGWSGMLGITFNSPKGIVFNSHNDLIIADWKNNCIRKISESDLTSRVAGYGDEALREGNGIDASIGRPWSLYIDDQDNMYTFSSKQNSFSRMVVITPSEDVRICDTRASWTDSFEPYDIAQDYDKKFLIPDFSVIYKMENTGWSIFTGNPVFTRVYQKDGPKEKARFYLIKGIESDKNNKLYITDYNSIRVIEKNDIVIP